SPMARPPASRPAPPPLPRAGRPDTTPPPGPQASVASRPHESEPPPGVARTIAPVQPQWVARPRLDSWSAVSKSAVAGALAALIVVTVFALVALVFLNTGSGKVFTASVGHGGEPLTNAVTVADGYPPCLGTRCILELAAGVHEVTVRAEG